MIRLVFTAQQRLLITKIFPSFKYVLTTVYNHMLLFRDFQPSLFSKSRTSLALPIFLYRSSPLEKIHVRSVLNDKKINIVIFHDVI